MINMRYIITGATGFVGTNLCLHFLENGHEVIGIDNRYKNIGSDANLKLICDAGATYHHVDIRNTNDVLHFFSRIGDVDAILHAAAQVAFKRSIENPRLDFEVNALGTFNLLEALRLYQESAVFVTASTNQVYGNLKQVPIQEYEKRFDFVDMPYGIPETATLDFLSPYGCSKGAADQYTIDYSRTYDLKTVVTRFGGIYGVNQYSYEDHGWVAYISKMVLQNKEFNRFGHGKQVRDILYISDIVEALEMCVKKIDVVKGEAINIAGGRKNSISVLELLDLLEDLTGNNEKSIVNPMRKGDKVVIYLDIRKAEKLLNWKPKYNIKEGINKLIEWSVEQELE